MGRVESERTGAGALRVLVTLAVAYCVPLCWAAACGSTRSEQPGRDEDINAELAEGQDAATGRASAGERCDEDAGCHSPLMCSFGRCHEECKASRDCAGGALCVVSGEDPGARVCQLDGDAQCERNRDCQGDQTCASDGTCRDECEAPDHCGTGQFCAAPEGVCVDEEDAEAGKSFEPASEEEPSPPPDETVLPIVPVPSGEPSAGMPPTSATVLPGPTAVPAASATAPAPNAGPPAAGSALDVLLVVDNSAAMADKQALLRDAVPELLRQAQSPPCFNESAGVSPAGVEGSCPAGSTPLLAPIQDIHVAVISSSLGSHGLLMDQAPESPICDDSVFRKNDKAHFIATVRPDVPSTAAQGFLAWDSRQDGLRDPKALRDLDELIRDFQFHMDAVGEDGCGFEAPLEAAYRFLSEPEPYEHLERVPCSPAAPDRLDCVAATGTDTALLEQRSVFLRDQSTVLVIFLTDEDDCSVQDRRHGYFTFRPTPLAGSTLACDTDPEGACCHSCLAPAPAACPTSLENGCAERSIESQEEFLDEGFNLRCFNQKQRFGVDFLYDTERYVAGFRNKLIAGRDNDPNNPLPNGLFAGGRSSKQVFVLALVGTPWQDVATDPADINSGIISGNNLDWSLFLSEPGRAAGDPFNVPSVTPRRGVHPITGEALSLTETNSINGHERDIQHGDRLIDDLQYACTYPLAAPKDCAAPGSDSGSCACTQQPNKITGETLDHATGNPLCRQEDGRYGTVQRFAKAYPAPRFFELLKGLGETAVLSSICPREALDTDAAAYGYRPALRAALRAIARK